MKRQRDSSSSKDTDIDIRCQMGNINSNDCYDEILQRNNNNGDDDLLSIRNSWLNERSPIIQGDSNTNVSSNSSAKCPRSATAKLQLKSLSQQLIQVKRRMWPAAEECAAAWETKPGEEFWNARDISNPMECLGQYGDRGLNQMFINRSAIKLANIDAVLDFKLTRLAHEEEKGRNFLFADLCGAPGGFSEYLVKRFQSNEIRGSCRGYGMSLVGKNEHGKGCTWCLDDIYENDNTSTFSINYRVLYGYDGTGDIYNWDNVISFQKEIEHDLQEAGIPSRKMNLVVADGGFDAQRDSECQEELAQKLILHEFATALQLLDVDGTLVLKLFGCQTESIRMAMRSMFDLFNSLEMTKPISSRPASSERYVILEGFKGLPAQWEGGQNWINNVLIGRCLQRDLSFYTSSVDHYLDQFDSDMLVLNLKACFAILSHLERKNAAERLCQSKREQRNCFPSMGGRNRDIDVKLYRHAWQLFI